MKVLTFHTKAHGPTAVFLPPATDAHAPLCAHLNVPAKVMAPAFTQVGSRGDKATWDQHSEILTRKSPYAGSWTVEDVPDTDRPHDALNRIRVRQADKELGSDTPHEAEAAHP